eukprot:scaffold83065_cov68-Cyclotella_meneghiniana.AAC.3
MSHEQLTYPVNGGVREGISMELEGSQNRVGRETGEWRWKRDGISGRKLGVSWAQGLLVVKKSSD